MAQPNFNISDVMLMFLKRDRRNKFHWRSDLTILRDYRKSHPAKFLSTLQWTFQDDPREYELINGLTSQPSRVMSNVFDILKMNKRKWEGNFYPLENLDIIDGRVLNGLIRRGMLDIHYANHEGVGKEGYYLIPFE